jgi:Lon protease-like protein
VEIPLFPLRTVLFPGMSLPLRIFEQRYRVMVQELLDSGGVFGIILIRQGNEVGGGAIPHEVETTARIEQCVQTEGGRFALTARGVRRFRLLEMLAPRPYPYGRIQLLDDDSVEPSRLLEAGLETVRATFPAYFRLALSLTDQWARGLRLPVVPHAMVNALAPWLQVPEETRQRLLEPESAADRIGMLAEVVDELLVRTREEAIEHRRTKYGALGVNN